MKKSSHGKLIKLAVLGIVGLGIWLYFVWPHMPPKVQTQSVQVTVQQPNLPSVTSPIKEGEEGQIIEEESPNNKPMQEATIGQPSFRHEPAKISIIIDDMGLDIKDSQRAIMLPSAITLSFMPYATRLREQTKEARDHGHELMLHMPMEPLGHADPGPGALLVNLPDEELKQRLDTALASFVGFDGINNHMGSKFTADAHGMELVIGELQPRHLFFLDSKTSAQTVGEHIARQRGLPTISRDVFLDDEQTTSAIAQQLMQTERVAQKKGYAVAIGHPHAVTLQTLENWIPDVQKRGFILVPVHDLINSQSSQP